MWCVVFACRASCKSCNVYRYPSPIPTRGHIVSSYLTTAVSTMRTRYSNLSRRRLVSIYYIFVLIILIIITECKLIYLPPYSPDYNPIEQAFSCIKAWLRRHHTDKSVTALSRACQHITPQMAQGFFRASGYI